jgi:hypothetical protein
VRTAAAPLAILACPPIPGSSLNAHLRRVELIVGAADMNSTRSTGLSASTFTNPGR